MNEQLAYTDTRPRAKGTGHAFGFEGNLGLPVIISAMVSVLLLTVLFGGGSHGLPIPARFIVGLAPLVLTTAYIVLLRSRKPPRYDVDLLRSWVNGRAFQPARVQPLHPYYRRPSSPGAVGGTGGDLTR
ncbi:MAG: hypothetical protein JO069_01315 [Verrucomicrobia bacterium]|nr:hypothetical protein [Verrucomicrobiota bacterium]